MLDALDIAKLVQQLQVSQLFLELLVQIMGSGLNYQYVVLFIFNYRRRELLLL